MNTTDPVHTFRAVWTWGSLRSSLHPCVVGAESAAIDLMPPPEGMEWRFVGQVNNPHGIEILFVAVPVAKPEQDEESEPT